MDMATDNCEKVAFEADIFCIAESLTANVAAGRANISSVNRLTYDNHVCDHTCQTQEIAIFYTKNKEVIVEMKSDDKTLRLTNCHKHRVEKNTVFKMQNTHACVVSGKIHVCTPEHCKFYQNGGCVTEDGGYACPLTGIVHEYADSFARHWSCDAIAESALDAHSLRQGRESQSKNTICILKTRVCKFSKFIQNSTRFMKELLPPGIIHKHLQTKINQSKVDASVSALCKYIRKVRRNTNNNKYNSVNLYDLKVLVYATLFQTKTVQQPDTFLETYAIENICKQYVISINNLYNILNENMQTKKHRFKHRVTHTSFASFFISMLYLCKSGLKDDSKVIIVKDALLQELLPSLNHIVRLNLSSPVLKQMSQIMYPAKMKHLTKYMLITKTMLCNSDINVENFAIDYKNITSGNTQITIETSTSEIKSTIIL